MISETFPELRRQVKDIVFDNPIAVAGGAIKTVARAVELARTDLVYEWGSFTTSALPGNGGRDYHSVYSSHSPFQLLYTFNSIGLLNAGMSYAEQNAKRLLELYTGLGKEFWFSISGNGVEDTLTLTKRALKAGFRIVTINGACPNKKDQPILCDIPDAVDEFFDRLDKEVGETAAVLLWKVSCGMRRPALAHNRERVRNSKAITGVITGNTIPNGFDYLEDGSTAIKTDNGIDRGGMAGPAIFPIALDHTQFMAAGLPSDKVVVHCGGVCDASDAAKAFKAGATLVQMQSAFREANENPTFVRDMNIDYLELPKHL